MPHRRAFTLVEMLVVVGCVVLLLGLVFPAVGRVQDAARAARCATNLRQLAVATQVYASVHEERYPAAILYFKTDAGVETAAWDWIQGPGGTVRPGPLWSYSDVPAEIFQCPAFDGASTFGSDPATGYSYNTTYIGAEGSLPKPAAGGGWIDGWSNARTGVPGPSHRRTSTTALFADAGWASGANKFMRAPLNSAEKNLQLVYAGGQAFRHRGCCQVCYLDGHCASVDRPCRGELATEALLDSPLHFPENGFLSEDDFAYDPR